VIRVAVDVGGTFTDVCVFDESTGETRIAKAPSTPFPIDGVLQGVHEAGVDLADVALFAHGTTVATNALLTRKFPRAAMVTTEGFRDVIEIRRGQKEDLWDVYKDVAPPYIRRRDRLVVPERIDYAGQIVEPLDEEKAREVARVIRRRGITSIAVGFINAYANGEHERKMQQILEEEIPGANVSISSEILPEIFEHERFSTTVTNAILRPLVGEYVEKLERELTTNGYGGDLLILHSGGGVVTAKTAAKVSSRLAGSGITAGAVAARFIAAKCGFSEAIGLDMGGTSTDISLIHHGELRSTKDWFIEYGYPICFPSVEVLTIGAGGGSLGWIDAGGALRNGPQSAGAVPGPACYGRGGTGPTNTDANLVLGRLGEDLLSGALHLDRSAAAEAIGREIATPMGADVESAADAMLEVANANMADALRLISVSRGYDPREFALVVFGGAGPLHATALARELSIPTVIVPPNPGITSALGCLLVDIRHDLGTMMFAQADGMNLDEVEQRFLDLEAEARERLRAESVSEENMYLTRSVDMRYVGQWRTLSVPVPKPLESLEAAVATFHAEHERAHNYRRDDAPVEIYRVNLQALGATPKPEFRRHEPVSFRPTPRGSRPVRFDGSGDFVGARVFFRDDLYTGAAIDGPAIIEQLDSTTLVPDGIRAEVDEWLNIRMQVPARAW
jgi:N-methylhydantoinase A